MTSTTYRVLAVPELLLQVFHLSSAEDLNSLALVCSSFAEMAIDTKWRTSTVPLTKLLAKLVPFYSDELGGCDEVRSEVYSDAHVGGG